MGLTSAKQHLQKTAIERVKAVVALPYRKQIAALHNLDEEAFWQYQHERLRAIYHDAVQHVPYYRDQPDLYPRRLPDASHPLDALRQLPILRKSVVKAETEKFWRQPALLGTAQHTTGGTTGTPLKIRASLMERGFTQAILDDRYAHIVGTTSPRILRMSGYLAPSNGDGEIFQSIPGTKFAYLSIYALSDASRDQILDAFRSFRPQVIHGYASALHQLALLFRESPLPAEVDPFIVVTTSETIMPQQREDIERFLRTHVFDEYGSQEGQHLIVECERGTMHIHPARGIVELLNLNSDDIADPGTIGRVVVSGLMSRTMPLIRYELGDTALSISSFGCACGLTWPAVGTVYGRMEDLVQTRDGRHIPLLSHSTLKDLDGIKESQIIQTDFDNFIYRLVLDPTLRTSTNTLEHHVRHELQKRMNYDIRVTFDYLDQLEKTGAGKHRAVVVDMQRSC